MRNRPFFVPHVKSLFLLVVSVFAFAAVAGYVQGDLLAAAIGALDVVILTALGIWAWGNGGSKSSAVERTDAEILDADYLAIPKSDYLASIIALGDRMASPDPEVRQLASMAYDAFKHSVKPL